MHRWGRKNINFLLWLNCGHVTVMFAIENEVKELFYLGILFTNLGAYLTNVLGLLLSYGLALGQV